MNDVIPALVRVLEQMLQAHRTLLSQIQKQQVALVRGDINQLNRDVQLLNANVERIQGFEEQRLSLVRKLADRYGMAPERLTVSFLAESLDHASSVRLKKVSGELAEVIEHIKRKNDENSELSRRSLANIDKTLELVSGTVGNSGYGQSQSPLGSLLLNLQG